MGKKVGTEELDLLELAGSEVEAIADTKPHKVFPVLQYARDEFTGKALCQGKV